MCSQTRNSCAKAFVNRSRSKNLKPKKSRGGQFDPPRLKASRVNAFGVTKFFFKKIKYKNQTETSGNYKFNWQTNILVLAK